MDSVRETELDPGAQGADSLSPVKAILKASVFGLSHY